MQGIAYLITALVVLTRSEVDVTKVFTASVLTTAVIGLALQETLGNVMAGLALQLERDLEIGDWISLDDRIAGQIREVRWRATTIVTKNGDLTLIPNTAITRGTIVNYSRPTTAHRQWIHVRVHFRHPPARVREVVVEAVRALPFVRVDPPPDCILHEFKDDACDVQRPLLDGRRPARRHDGQRRPQRHLVRASPGRHGDPVPVAQREPDRDERGPRAAQGRRGVRAPDRRAVAGRRVPGAGRRDDRSAVAPHADADLRAGRDDPAPGRSGRLAVRRPHAARWPCRSACRRRAEGGGHAGRRGSSSARCR